MVHPDRLSMQGFRLSASGSKLNSGNLYFAPSLAAMA